MALMSALRQVSGICLYDRVSSTRREAAAARLPPRTRKSSAAPLLRRPSGSQRIALSKSVRASASESAQQAPAATSQGKPGSRMVYAPATFSELLK
jgi:hypothetical protein